MLWLLATWAAASPLVITGAEHLTPGVPARIEHASPGARSVTLAVPPGSAVRPLPRRGDVWSWEIIPATGASTVELTLTEDGAVERTWLQVTTPGESTLVAPARIDAVAGGQPVRFVVTGAADPAQLSAFTSDGVVDVLATGTPGQLEVVLTPEPGAVARPVIVGLRRTDLDQRPVWVVARLRIRRHLPFATEPGVRLDLTVSGRPYGPFEADSRGVIDASIDQYPGESRAIATLSDDLGNVTRSEVALGIEGGTTFAIGPAGRLATGQPAPPLWVRAVRDDGSALSIAPTCVTSAGALALREVEPGTWLAIGAPDRPVLDHLRVECSANGGSPQQARVRVDPGGPVTLDLRVWPAELRTDFPTAEIRASLEDATGARIPPDGLQLSAARGAIHVQTGEDALVLEAEYDGAAAATAGTDTVTATWRPAAVAEGLDHIRLAWGPVPLVGSVEGWAQLLDAQERPVRGMSVSLDVGGPPKSGVTDDDGWFHVQLPMNKAGPGVLTARAHGQVARAALVPGEPAAGGAGLPRLVTTEEIRFSAGRVYGIAISVDPPVLRAGPGSYAIVSVRVEDRAGEPIPDPPPVIEADAGRLGPVDLRPDGTWFAEWYPDGIERPQEVSVSARASEVASETRLEVAPRSATATLGARVGGLTNFGGVSSPIAGLDLEVRLRSGWLGDAVGLRLGGAVYAWNNTTVTDLGAPIRFRSLVVPIEGSLVFRREARRAVPWGAFGIAVAAHRIEAFEGEERLGSGVDWRVGPQGAAGLALPLGAGEAEIGLRGLWLPAGGGELGFAGNVGGLSADVGYRIRF